MQFTDVLNLFAGVALFLFGMSLMGDALEQSAGGKLKAILGKMTASPIRGFLLGAGVTAIIQSSSATTVMLVGFVNSGIMTLSGAIPVIMGANVGTTITAWILSLTGIEGSNIFLTMLKPSSFTPVLAVIGIVLYMFLSGSKKKSTGLILLGFSVLIFGMDMMSDSIAPLAEVEWFRNLFVMFNNPLLGLLVGALVTAVIQSSSASVGILQALAGELNVAGLAPAITVGMTLPIIMGQNIGTCVTAAIGSVGANKDAKRVAAVHLSFNIIGSSLILLIYSLFQFIILPNGFGFAGLAATESTIAICHTAFNLICTAILLPCYKLLERLAYIVVKDNEKSEEKTTLLDERLLDVPSVAIERVRNVAIDMSEISSRAVALSEGLLEKYENNGFEDVAALEDKADIYEDEIGSYLIKITGLSNLSERDSLEVTKLLHLIGDLERLSDHAVNLAESAKEMHEKGISFSVDARAELKCVSGAIQEVVSLAVKSFKTGDTELAKKVEPLESVIDILCKQIKENHIGRLKRNECTIELGFILTDILTDLERISDHCSNIAGCIIEIEHSALDVHSYTRAQKAGDGIYSEHFEKYLEKYNIA